MFHTHDDEVTIPPLSVYIAEYIEKRLAQLRKIKEELKYPNVDYLSGACEELLVLKEHLNISHIQEV